MNVQHDRPARSRLARLARPAQPLAGGRSESEVGVERCELCAEPIPAEHRHVLDLVKRELLCACRACSLLFDRAAAGGAHYRLVPDRSRSVVDFQLDDHEWQALMIPVEMAFFFRSSAAGRVVAFYPSPMGATESLLSLEAWDDLRARNPVLDELEPDVEALLVNRARGAREYWLVPVDACYRLVGIIRTHWKGFGGGEEVWAAIRAFFDEVRQAAIPVTRDGEEARWQISGSASPM